MGSDKQWRIETGHFLRGVVLEPRRWHAPSEHWDHDHCSCCWVKFAEWEGPEIQHSGYTTTDEYEHGAGYHWVCEECFRDLKDEMNWRLAPPQQTE
jgi:hypothetical protein